MAGFGSRLASSCAALGRASALRHTRASPSTARAAVELVVRDEVIAAPQTSLNGPMSGTRQFATVRLDLADVKAVKSHLGGTVNDVVLAICAGGLRHLLLARGDALPEGVRAQVPVNIRAQDREHSLGNELTSLFVELPVTEADPLARYRRVQERAQELKAGSQRAGGKTIVDLADMGPPLAGNLIARSMFGGTRMFNLTITNVPGPQERLYAFGAPLVEVLPLVPLFAGHTIGIAAVTYAGQMVFGPTRTGCPRPTSGYSRRASSARSRNCDRRRRKSRQHPHDIFERRSDPVRVRRRAVARRRHGMSAGLALEITRGGVALFWHPTGPAPPRSRGMAPVSRGPGRAWPLPPCGSGGCSSRGTHVGVRARSSRWSARRRR